MGRAGSHVLFAVYKQTQATTYVTNFWNTRLCAKPQVSFIKHVKLDGLFPRSLGHRSPDVSSFDRLLNAATGVTKRIEVEVKLPSMFTTRDTITYSAAEVCDLDITCLYTYSTGVHIKLTVCGLRCVMIYNINSVHIQVYVASHDYNSRVK